MGRCRAYAILPAGSECAHVRNERSLAVYTSPSVRKLLASDRIRAGTCRKAIAAALRTGDFVLDIAPAAPRRPASPCRL